MWLRHEEKIYTIFVVRNVDGMRKFYNMGQNSIQKAAVCILERYYIDFTEYNPYMPRPLSRTKVNKLQGLKLYDLEGKNNGDGMIASLESCYRRRSRWAKKRRSQRSLLRRTRARSTYPKETRAISRNKYVLRLNSETSV